VSGTRMFVIQHSTNCKFDGASVTYILDIFHKCPKW